MMKKTLWGGGFRSPPLAPLGLGPPWIGLIKALSLISSLPELRVSSKPPPNKNYVEFKTTAKNSVRRF